MIGTGKKSWSKRQRSQDRAVVALTDGQACLDDVVIGAWNEFDGAIGISLHTGVRNLGSSLPSINFYRLARMAFNYSNTCVEVCVLILF